MAAGELDEHRGHHGQHEHLDVAVVGAGISGISAAHALMTRCPDKTFAIFEGRPRIGGTWDLFRYPGIRSDSDMHTLGFPWNPWPHDHAIGDGQAILRYLKDTARDFGIDAHIRFSTRVVGVSWRSDEARWRLQTRNPETGKTTTLTCSFLWICSGYYRYDRGHLPDFPGVERFRGEIVHPQRWTDDVTWAGKRVVVIGSGATAVTLVPALAEDAAHVVMLQRSPSYVLSVPPQDVVGRWLHRLLPDGPARAAIRWKNVLVGIAFYEFCQRYPSRAKRWLMAEVQKQVGPDCDVAVHFNPRYGPWDERLCMVPDGDLFTAIRSGDVEVVTDHIEAFTEGGLQLRSGRELQADLVVTATGLELQFLGGAEADIDGVPIRWADHMLYKGMMLSDVPNAAFCVGYSNASWTLKVELTARYVTDLLRMMDKRGATVCYPPREAGVDEAPPMDLDSGYIRRAHDRMPKQGDRRPWRLYQNYVLDKIGMRPSRIDDGTLIFKSNPEPRP